MLNDSYLSACMFYLVIGSFRVHYILFNYIELMQIYLVNILNHATEIPIVLKIMLIGLGICT